MKVGPTLKVRIPDVLKAEFLLTKFAHLMDLGRKAYPYKMYLYIVPLSLFKNSKGKIQIHT